MPRPVPLRTSRLRQSHEGVSDVMGSVILLGIAVVFAGAFVLALFNIPGPAPAANAALHAYALPEDATRARIEHRGGPALPIDALVATVTLDGVATRQRVSDGVAFSPGWSAVDASGAAKAPDARLGPGDALVYANPAMPGKTASLLVADGGANAVVLGTTTLQRADAQAPTFAGPAAGRTRTTTSLVVNFSEPLSTVSAADFTVAGSTITAMRLLGQGTQAEITLAAPLAPDARPPVASRASVSGTRDVAGNLFAPAATLTPTDGLAPDTPASPPAPTTTATTASVAWTTSELSDSVVQYGPTPALGLTAADGTLVLAHAITLTDLTPSTRYHFRVVSADAAGNARASGIGTFTTPAAAGTGGGSGASGPQTMHLAFSATTPVVDGGIPTKGATSYTVTLRDAAGQPVRPTSPVTVTLSSTSPHASFLTVAGTPTETLTIAGASSASFNYVDHRTRGSSLLSASAQGVLPATTMVKVTDRGTVASAGDAPASLLVHLNTGNAWNQNRPLQRMSLGLVNPTPSDMTIGTLRLQAVAYGNATGINPFATLSSSGDFACAWTVATVGATTTATCALAAPLALPAYDMRQTVIVFSPPNTGVTTSGWHASAQAVVTLPTPATVSSVPTVVRFVSSTGENVNFLGLSAPGGTEQGDFTATGGTENAFTVRWFVPANPSSSFSTATRIYVPAGWKNVNVPTTPSLGNFGVGVRQPTETEAGWITITQVHPGSANTGRDLSFRATLPPAPADGKGAVPLFTVEVTSDAGTISFVNHLGVRVT